MRSDLAQSRTKPTKERKKNLISLNTGGSVMVYGEKLSQNCSMWIPLQLIFNIELDIFYPQNGTFIQSPIVSNFISEQDCCLDSNSNT